ncbi:hypothetical protein KIN20_030862 [Parelaphostrongylus tenuis]|uniref:Uncharacterized protein n=1 Tax=Parelaphostrongylus tenuis TaxID=148309 RepID=A0AAD5R4M1_PARTN|nr:hypothetical protein KIN20_030862 [Parelaphostrongylus tenuis]
MLFGSLVATTVEGAKGFVQRLAMQTIIDVLERQGRSALLPDAVISTILSQLTVDISYTPMNCPMVTDPEEMRESSILSNPLGVRGHRRSCQRNDKTFCVIVGNTVTGICTVAMGQQGKCNMPVNGMVTVTAINGTHLKISGTLSRMMWQSVVDRAVRMLASGPFGLHFISARATVCGN